MKRQSCKEKKMKGQLVFEFVIAALMLFAIIIYTINYLTINSNLYHERFLSNMLESKAMQVSEILMNDPVNGIVDEWPLLDTAKMSAFNDSCDDDYVSMLYNFSMIDDFPYTELHHMSVVVNGTDGQVYVDCGRTPPTIPVIWYQAASKATVTRYGYVPPPEDKLATIEVVVW